MITADNTSLPEVAGEGALIFDAKDYRGMAEAVLRLVDSEQRDHLRQRGFTNLGRFSLDDMLTHYFKLYEEALAAA